MPIHHTADTKVILTIIGVTVEDIAQLFSKAKDPNGSHGARYHSISCDLYLSGFELHNGIIRPGMLLVGAYPQFALSVNAPLTRR